MADYRVFDIETIPDLALYDASRLDYKLSADGVGSDRSARVNAFPAFPPQHAQRVVSISWVDLESDESKENWFHFKSGSVHTNWTHGAGSSLDRIEAHLLAAFGYTQNNDRACLVSWNGRTFDLPVIALRSMKQGIQTPWYWAEKDVKYRYAESGHIDVMDYLADYGAAKAMSLDFACKLIGLPGKAGEVHGSNIEEQYAKGDDANVMAEVSKYCLRDSVQTAVLFVRTRYQKGLLTAKEYNKTVTSFAEHETVKGVLPDANWDLIYVRELP